MKFDRDGNIIVTLTANEAHSLARLIEDGATYMDGRIERDEDAQEDMRSYTDAEIESMRQIILHGLPIGTALDGMARLATTNGAGSWVTRLPGLLDTIHRLVAQTDPEKFNRIQRDELRARFPWLDTNEEAPGSDAVDGILDWYRELAPIKRSGTG